MARFYAQAQSWIYPDVGNAVYAKRNITDEWTWLPFMYCTEAQESLAPTMPRATLVANYGNIARAEFGSYTVWNPYFINGAYVKVVAFTRWSAATLWYGIVDTETVVPHGKADFPAGQQTYTAYGLEHLLDRRVMFGAYAENGAGSGVVFIDEPLVFNRARDRGIGIQGNKSSGETNAFGEVGTDWTNLDILNYILARWVNTNSGITFNTSGITDVLDDVIEQHDFQGLTPYQAINKLIQRERGMSWQISVDSNGLVYVHVNSLFPVAIATDAFSMPANAFQTDVSFSGLANLKTDFTFDNVTLFDRIIVMGGPMYSCFTLSYEDATFEEDWTSGEETDYKAGTGTPADEATLHDSERNTDKFERVYGRHKIIDDWNWYAGDGEGGTQKNAAPYSSEGGYPSGTLEGNVGITQKRFERELPIEVEGTNSDDPEYRKPFVIIEVPDPENPGSFIDAYAEKLDAHELQNINVSMADQGLAIDLSSTIPHVMAIEDFDTDDSGTEATNIEPEVDYRSIIATVFVKTNNRLKVDSVNLGYPLWDVGRDKLIEIPDAISHYIVPGTVTEVTDGALVKDATGGFVRDDSERLRTAMIRAISWYAVPRAKIAYELGAITTFLPTGAMIRNHWGPEGWTRVNTPVTRRVWRWATTPTGSKQSTTVETAFDELDFVR